MAAWRRVATHAVWAALSVTIGFRLVGYFRPPVQILADLRSGELGAATLGFWAAASALSYLDFVVVRQTFCKLLCPYARFQSVLFDRDTRVVAYDTRRGEPRGKAGSVDGDCVDCGLCVAVCPTGIDIRLQLECIACTQCIDACNNVMSSLGRQPNLIGYRSLASLGDRRPTRPLRPRVVVYGALGMALVLVFGAALGRRLPLDLEVERLHDALYSRTADGRIGNAYELHLQSRDRANHEYRIEVEAPEGFELVTGVNPIRIGATSALAARVFVVAPTEALRNGRRAKQIHFVVEEVGNPKRLVVRPSRFMTPPPGEKRG